MTVLLREKGTFITDYDFSFPQEIEENFFKEKERRENYFKLKTWGYKKIFK